MTGAVTPNDPTPQESAPLQAPLLKAALTYPQGQFARVDVVASAGSTNTDLAASAADDSLHCPDLSVLIADAQPAGKGRLGRSWDVPVGSAMISSVFLRPAEQALTSEGRSDGSAADFAHTGYGWLSVLAGVALCDSLRTLTGLPAELKWPNDVVVKGRKLAGILAQVVPAAMAGPRAQLGLGVVVGVGVNVSLTAEQLPTERATSLLVEGAEILDRNVLLPAYLNKFAELYKEFVAVGGDAGRALGVGPSLLQLMEAFMGTLGQPVRVELPGGKMLLGTATALQTDGSLVVRDEGGTVHSVSAGDVIHLRRTDPDGTVHYA
ncbi:biotin--[acetyl-CoA-carboxylase] ligase [Arthrobacter sp. TWP1-1]|uniref:biotin--[acetyl-CoA-carboxylase] ligase n=1 Tax=Arthrobacter sp. TWP1-1 TaxID=2804568 RepID=UPI003CF2835B